MEAVCIWSVPDAILIGVGYVRVNGLGSVWPAIGSHNFRFRSFHSLNIFKICQTVVGISMISKFHEFSDLIFGGFLQIGPTVRCMAAFEMAVM